MSFATRLTRALAEENPGFLTAVSADLTTFHDSIDAELVTYGASDRVRAWFEDQLLDFAINLADEMHAVLPVSGEPLLLETGYDLLLETGDILSLEYA
jgi:hypothetical protein